MTTTALEIYNLALSAAHAPGRLTTTSDQRREAEECNLWYDLVVRTVQEGAHWPCCKRFDYLTQLEERTAGDTWTAADAAPRYSYKYALPADYLRAWNLLNYEAFDIHYDASTDQNVLSTNTDDAVLVYSCLQDDVAHWAPAQTQATIYALAAVISGGLRGKQSVMQKNIQLANSILIDAQAIAASEGEATLEFIPPSILARGGISGVASSRFLYPFGSLFTGAPTNV